jgi:hypothetical protein
MLLDVVIAACAALAAAGTVYGTVRLLGVRPPKWVVPAVAAAAVLGVTAYQRYDWHNQVAARLPAGDMVVVEEVESSLWLEPWSLVAPVISSVVVLDRASVRRHPAHPGMVMADLFLVRRDDDTAVIRHLVDCAGRRVAPLPAEAVFTADGLPASLDWRDDGPEALFAAACAGDGVPRP